MREMKKKKNREEDRDFFGELPIELIHTILSFLIISPSKLNAKTKKEVEVAQTIILSKKFRQAWYTFPDLYFSDFLTFSKILFLHSSRPVLNPYQCQPFSNNAKERFANYILHTVAKYQRHDYMTRTSHLIAGVQDEKIANILNQSIKAKENGVKTMVRIRPHNLLQTFFSLVQLVSLDIYWSHLVKNDVEDCDIFMNCPFVRRLNVGSIIIHEAVLEKLFHSCPLIEEIKLDSCKGIETIKIFNLPNLRTLDITTTKNQTVYVNADSLELMTYSQDSFSNVLVIKSAPNLKIVKLLWADITDAHFHNLIANCPILEELTLRNCDTIQKINVSSHSLRFLSIIVCRDLMEVKIDAPNLNVFEYYGNRVLSPLSFATRSYGKNKSSVTLFWSDDDGPEEVPSFLDLSEFLTTFKHTDNISLKFISTEISFDRNIVDELRDENNKPEFEEVYVEVSSPSSTYSAIMEGMLWSFSPKIISVKRDSKEDDEFIMYLCEQLLVQHDDHLNISPCASNCWRNYFKQAKSSERDDEWRPLHSWNSLAQVLENLGDHYTLKLSHD